MNDFEKLSLKKFKIKSILPDATILCLGKRRSGKCLAKGTQVLMYSGMYKNIEKIQKGELVMGDDSTARRVLSTHHGHDLMYKVKFGDKYDYTVNSEHILSLQWYRSKTITVKSSIDNRTYYLVTWFDSSTITEHSRKFYFDTESVSEVVKSAQIFYDRIVEDLYVDISVKDYLNLSSYYQKYLRGYKVSVEFSFQRTLLDSYSIGYWIGKYGNTISKINYFDMTDNKSIGKRYLINTTERRFQLLAGFIDGAGKTTDTTEFGTNCEFSVSSHTLLEDLIFLLDSLGIVNSSHNSSNNSINNSVYTISFCLTPEQMALIPSRIKMANGSEDYTKYTNYKNELAMGISIESCGYGEYYGIELDNNHRYLIKNCIVTHNSWLVRDIFYHHRHIPSGVVFSGTEEASPFFSDFIPDCFIHSEYNPELIETIMNKQKKKIREAKLQRKSETGKLPSNNVFIVLDDMLHDAQNWKKEKTIKSIFFNGRHFNFLFILTMQYPLGITPELRSNIDYVFIFNEPSVKNRKKIYDDYAGMIPSFDHFCNILDACTQNHECLVIKTSGNSNNLRDQIFWYKAEAHEEFHVGHPKLWKYHKRHYNEKYEDAAEKDQEEMDKLKKKFAKTRKLKVLVSRQGEIIGVENEGQQIGSDSEEVESS